MSEPADGETEALLSQAKIIHLQPDDLIVMKFPGVDVDADLAQRIKTIVGERRVMILADDVRIGVVEWEDL